MLVILATAMQLHRDVKFLGNDENFKHKNFISQLNYMYSHCELLVCGFSLPVPVSVSVS